MHFAHVCEGHRTMCGNCYCPATKWVLGPNCRHSNKHYLLLAGLMEPILNEQTENCNDQGKVGRDELLFEYNLD